MRLVVRKRGVNDNSKIFFLIQLEGGLSFVHMEKIQKEKVLGAEENQKFNFRYIKCDISIRYPSTDVK